MMDLLDIPMPYSAVAYPVAGQSAMNIVPEHRNGISNYPAGLTWAVVA